MLYLGYTFYSFFRYQYINQINFYTCNISRIVYTQFKKIFYKGCLDYVKIMKILPQYFVLKRLFK